MSATYRRPPQGATWMQLVDRRWPHLWNTHLGRNGSRLKPPLYYSYFLDREGKKKTGGTKWTQKVPPYVATITCVRPIKYRLHLGWKCPSSLLGRSLLGWMGSSSIRLVCTILYHHRTDTQMYSERNKSLFNYIFVAHFNHYWGGSSQVGRKMALNCHPQSFSSQSLIVNSPSLFLCFLINK